MPDHSPEKYIRNWRAWISDFSTLAYQSKLENNEYQHIKHQLDLTLMESVKHLYPDYPIPSNPADLK